MSEDNKAPEESSGLSRDEELLLQQLTQVRLWHQKSKPESTDDALDSVVRPTQLPARWDLTAGTVLHDWQERCVDAWFANSGKGVIKVVTGAGKTILALAIVERLQQTKVPDLRVVIVVPTVVLMNQWRDEILSRSNDETAADTRVTANQRSPAADCG
jgi:superfamily II DNA or RNA helicase